MKSDGAHEYELWSNIPPQLSFTEAEEKQGREMLKALGIRNGEPFICFFARDHSYLENALNFRTRREWSYHDYRDCSIENYLPAIEALADTGIWALRMGAVVKREVHSKSTRIIDYASRFRSDFADVYLMSHCRYFVGDTSGINSISCIFGIPAVLLNMVPISHLPRNRGDLFLPKMLWSIESKRFMTLRETIEIGADKWQLSSLYKSAGIEVIQNTAEEITAAVLEMEARMNGTWKSTEEDEELQKLFWSIFPEGHPVKKCTSRIGADFLREHRDWLK